jgi:hypothetical protein
MTILQTGGVKHPRPILASNNRVIAALWTIHRRPGVQQGIILSPENHPSIPPVLPAGFFFAVCVACLLYMRNDPTNLHRAAAAII